ncbi:tyrosine--tRNA ligase [Brucepastera parasyntrophica]|uniref:tyrosine--tRNA ligase n=1 Tax=Brucepastera parasyntrophica TaxID=2880008 RepID=UPI00210B90A3|nr:tyrosine--tRNA ligase [Brucepastera parasyntrophica]ULQ59456.1 tyrosine--tRNA ligase [Brucepastera parasyntrophica]
MNKALETLKERGFFQQCTDIDGLSRLMDEGPVTFYVGCDPTGPSLHIGHMVPFFALRHLRSAGHRGIALVGGGTARIGDPSGKTEMRKVSSYEQIDRNTEAILAQLNRFIGFDGKTALSENNKNWLADLNYIDFLRDIGSHFSVNRMLTFEAYKKRLETGLTFIEFNYQLLQSYDYLKLNEWHGAALQIGGDDQWGNIVAGIELIRRINGNQVFGLTFPLVTTSDGKKMGKTEKGALFLDPDITTPYDFFQYWRNVTDADTRKFLLLFTFLPVSEIDTIMAGNINEAKERLAYEVTGEIHGKEEADKALAGARAAFSGGGDKNAMPTVQVEKKRFTEGIGVIDLFAEAKLGGSKSDIRRLVEQGGIYVADRNITDVKAVIGQDVLDPDGEVILRAGKKKFVRITTG